MALKVSNHGNNNLIEIDPLIAEQFNGIVQIKGDNNRLMIRKASSKHGSLNVTLGQNNIIEIAENCHISDLTVFTRTGARIIIGMGTIFNGKCTLNAHEPGNVVIGSNCMFAAQTMLTNSDMHSIIDLETGARLNHARDVIVGNHVWVGAKACLLKGSQVGNDSIIGFGSVLTRQIPANSIAAGNPARVLKSGVTWRIDLGGAPNVTEMR